MEHVVLERHVQRIGDFDADIQHQQFIQLPEFFYARIEAALVGQFHDQIRFAFPFIEGINVDDVGVIQLGAGPGFADEIVEGIRFQEDFLLGQLHGDKAFQHGVPRAVYRGHAAGADLGP